MIARPRPQLRLWRRVAAAALGMAVAGTGLMSTPASAMPAPASAPTAVSASAVEAPTADVVDLDFAGGTTTEHAQGLAPTTWGTPSYGTDDSLREDPTDVLKVDGVDDAVSVEVDPWTELAGGFTIECVFRVDTAMPVSGEKDLCSNKEAGGFSIYVNGANLGTMAQIGGGYKSVTVPIDGNRWYHALSVWDGSTLNLYVNGALAASTAATGALLAPVATSRRFVVGADSAPSGIGQVAPPSSYAAARIYSSAVTAEQAAQLAGRYNTVPEAPAADVLDVDFADGTAKDRAQDLSVTTWGAPEIAEEDALSQNVASFDGADDAYSYAFADQWSKITNSVSIECVFRANGSLPNTAEQDLCSSKESGGYSMVIYGDQLTFTAYIGGAYRSAGTTIASGRWYHAVGVFDGSSVKLYVDGKLAKQTAVSGTLGLPSTAGARNAFYVGADAVNQFYAPATIRAARIFTRPLTQSDITALNIAALGEIRRTNVALKSSVPARDSRLTEPTEFEVEIDHAGSATGWRYALDGQAINPGEEIGSGLKAGTHTIAITATDVFGNPIDWQIPFTSAAIPTGGGTDTGQGRGKVTLSAIADDPDGGQVTTTFNEATATAAEGGFQGVVPVLPTSLEFTYTDGGRLTGQQRPDGDTSDSPSTGQIPFQRYDVSVPASASGRQIVWTGVVDPERAVTLRAWRPSTQEWVELATARGLADGDTVLRAKAGPLLVDGDAVHVLVTGEDPFADDLSPRDESAQADKDHFDNPEDYDFSLAHFTDTQYLSEGAAGGTYDDWDGKAEPTDVMKAEEQAIWQHAYQAETRWIANNAASRKIAYTAHTGDVIENDISNPLATDPSGNLLFPGLNEQVQRENKFASEAQQTLDDAGLVNQVVAGNHDNQSGAETGPASRFSTTFSADRYYDAAKRWPAAEDASYHAWDETTDDQGNTIQRGRDNQNNYVLFSAGGLDFVAVGLSYGVTEEEAEWASSIFERYHDRNGILLTHAYLAPSGNPDGRGAKFSTDGSRAYREIVEANPNVFLVLAGHEHGVGTNLKTNIGAQVSHNVVELLADYQFYTVAAGELFADKVDESGNIDLDGDGVVDHKSTDRLQFGASFLRLLQFDVDRAEMSIDTYSPHLDNFGATEYDTNHRYNGSEDNLTLPVDLTSRVTSFGTDSLTVVTPTDTVIGEGSARSGWPVSVEWTGLTEGGLYAWTSTSRTASGDQVGSINQYGGVFVATAAGTDATPPVIDVPVATTIEVGEVFDPMAGVSATDNTDGDISDRIQVIGTVDTTTAGSYALTYLVSDTNGNQVVAPRMVTVKAAPNPHLRPSQTSAKDVQVTFGQRLQLTANVSPKAATGSVHFIAGEDVLCEATVKKGRASCVVGVLPPPGTYTVEAVYYGDRVYRGSSDSFKLTVRQRR